VCGIAGFVGSGGARDLAAMSAAVAHRGPDGVSEWIDAARSVHVAHRRLAVLDPAHGAQPMWNEDRTVAVIFNGEIYNHHELRRELLAQGHVFRSSHSDTEVLVHGYEAWGDALPCRLNGMFAFAIVDLRRDVLFLARDRFGEKPLYYFAGPRCFAFASELTALRMHRDVPSVTDPRAVQKYFAYGFVPAPSTLYKRLHKLPGGHWMRVDLRTLSVNSHCYWRFELEPEGGTAASRAAPLAEELRSLLTQAVQRRLASDVPLGVFLSGGLDSTAVLACATRVLGPGVMRSFSIGFDDPSFDETPFARLAAQALSSVHHERRLHMHDAAALVGPVLGRLDDPIADGSILPTHLLSRFAREHVTVALGGDGGDELFAGYDPFKALAIAQRYERWVPRRVHTTLRRIVETIPPSTRNMSLEFRLKRALRGVSYRAALWNPVWLAPLDPDAVVALFDEPVRVDELYEEAIAAWDAAASDDVVDRSLEFYTRFYLQDDILTKVDRASMMVSLECRAPFLDNDLVEFARRLPSVFKLRSGTTKWILRKALQGLVPDVILARPKKGFGMPLQAWSKQWQAQLPIGRDTDIGATASGHAQWADLVLACHPQVSHVDREGRSPTVGASQALPAAMES